MKIGIISTYKWLKKWDNYGTLFQNYALQKYLRNHGHQTYWIRAGGGRLRHKEDELSGVRSEPDMSRGLVAGSLSFFLRMKKSFVRRIHDRRYQLKIDDFNRANPRNFHEFFYKYVPHTEHEYKQAELIANPPAADAYIAGSDQIWGYVSSLYFLGFGSASTKRIAYAASAPWGSLSAEWFALAREEVKRFDAVSVREVDGLDVCLSIGRRDAVQVLDPTMLLDKEDYLSLVTAEGHDKVFDRPLVLCYFISMWKLGQVPWPAIERFAIKQEADLKVVPLQGSELIFPSKYVFTPSPTEWLNAYDKSSCVLTNSFHGVLFAIIMRKPFLVVLLKGQNARENCRFISILEALGLAERILEGESNKVTDSDIARKMFVDICWDSVESRLKSLRYTSESFLLTSLQ